jgi:hypothetical protein
VWAIRCRYGSQPLVLKYHPSRNSVQRLGENQRRPARLSGAEVHRRELILADEGQMAESQLSELRNMRVLLEEARMLARNLAYHRRARLEASLGQVLEEIDRQIEELRTSDQG